MKNPQMFSNAATNTMTGIGQTTKSAIDTMGATGKPVVAATKTAGDTIATKATAAKTAAMAKTSAIPLYGTAGFGKAFWMTSGLSPYQNAMWTVSAYFKPGTAFATKHPQVVSVFTKIFGKLGISMVSGFTVIYAIGGFIVLHKIYRYIMKKFAGKQYETNLKTYYKQTLTKAVRSAITTFYQIFIRPFEVQETGEAILHILEQRGMNY